MRQFRRRRELAGALAALALGMGGLAARPRQACAWGEASHRAVCEIAYLEVGPGVRARIDAVMSQQKDARYRRFADACTWADDEKGDEGSVQYRRRHEHYANVPRDLETISRARCAPGRKCLFSAIRSDLKRLGDGSGTKSMQALEFLGHWIGDLHQPLHISFEDDRGGNDIPVATMPGCRDLHSVWDRCIPDALSKKLGTGRNGAEFGRRLQADITPAQRSRWRQGSVTDWAAESLAITRRTSTRYCLPQGRSCCYDAASCENTAGNDRAGWTHRDERLPAAYDDDQTATVKEQLQKAGVRLAKLLEDRLP